MYKEAREFMYMRNIVAGLWSARFFAAAACFGPGMSSAVRNLVCKG
jgi:hypothetical protein